VRTNEKELSSAESVCAQNVQDSKCCGCIEGYPVLKVALCEPNGSDVGSVASMRRLLSINLILEYTQTVAKLRLNLSSPSFARRSKAISSAVHPNPVETVAATSTVAIPHELAQQALLPAVPTSQLRRLASTEAVRLATNDALVTPRGPMDTYCVCGAAAVPDTTHFNNT
jgi:hypothetical protein